MGEFGRTPKINGTAGRDHWPFCYSVMLAGGGIRGGIDVWIERQAGAYPDTDAVTPATSPPRCSGDWASTRRGR